MFIGLEEFKLCFLSGRDESLTPTVDIWVQL